MSCPRYCFVFTYVFLSGSWSFYCIYADTLEEARKKFKEIPNELYYIKSIDRKDNIYTAAEEGFEPELRVYSSED